MTQSGRKVWVRTAQVTCYDGTSAIRFGGHVTRPIISESLILLDGANPALTAEDVISRLCSRLEAEGYVGPGYLQEVLDREARFPTALPTLPYATAIPHGDPVDVHDTGVAVAILEQPIPFHSMDMPEEQLAVRAVLLLAVARSAQHVPTLRWVCEILNSPEMVERLVTARSPAAAIKVLSPLLEATHSGG